MIQTISSPCPSCGRPTYVKCYHHSPQWVEELANPDNPMKITCPNCCGHPQYHDRNEEYDIKE